MTGTGTVGGPLHPQALGARGIATEVPAALSVALEQRPMPTWRGGRTGKVAPR